MFPYGRVQLIVRDHRRGKAPRESLLARDLASKQQGLGSPAQANDPREQPADPHVSAREPDAREQKPKARRFRQHADVGRGRQDSTGAGGDAVDRCDHRLRHFAQIAHTGAGRPGEFEDVPCPHLEQLGDDLVDIPARTETATLAADDEHADVLALAQRIGQVTDIGVNVKGQGVEPLWTRERNGGDPLSLFVIEVVPPLHFGRTATASISINAAGSTRERTSISVDAG